MVGVLLTLLFSAGATGVGLLLARPLLKHLDPALRLGIGALIGLGLIGFITLPIGLLPGGLQWGLWLVVALCAAGVYGFFLQRKSMRASLPSGLALLFPLALALAVLMALVSVLAPSDMNDWDTLAYHLAVPKLWLEHGRIDYIPYIHHSNFPFVVDNLYLWGLQWGGQSGAKAFQLAFYFSGMLSIFGLARQRHGQAAAWWSLLTFALIPAAMWEAGTAYIDLAHGLYAGLGILFAALAATPDEEDHYSRNSLLLAAVLLGFGAASKYTGLQTVFAVGVVLVASGFMAKRAKAAIAGALLLGSIAIVLALPWLLRNQLNVANPVYPFFYEQLGAKNWDQRRAAIYKNEQQTFGVGRNESGRDPLAIGHAVLGLAYQPGRFVNPGQEQGQGSPLGGLGMAVISVLLLWMISGKAGRFEGITLATIIVSALMWFFLSQQSRYILTWAIPLSVLAGGAVVRLMVGKATAAMIAIQAVITLYLGSQMSLANKLPVLLGSISSEEYQRKNIPFYEGATFMNKELAPGSKVALYDEVFGYLLDVPYFWANPGHSTVIPYDGMASGSDFAREMRARGFTHAYVSITPVVKAPDFVQRWLGSMGLTTDPPMDPVERRKLFADWESKWQVLLADAVKQGDLVPVQAFGRRGILFKFK